MKKRVLPLLLASLIAVQGFVPVAASERIDSAKEINSSEDLNSAKEINSSEEIDAVGEIISTEDNNEVGEIELSDQLAAEGCVPANHEGIYAAGESTGQSFAQETQEGLAEEQSINEETPEQFINGENQSQLTGEQGVSDQFTEEQDTSDQLTEEQDTSDQLTEEQDTSDQLTEEDIPDQLTEESPESTSEDAEDENPENIPKDGEENEDLDLVGESADKASKLAAPTIKGVYNSVKGGDISWNKVSGATGYIVYRFRSAEKTKKVAEVSASTTRIYDSAIKNGCWGRVYHYYVVGVKNGTPGNWSKPAVLQRVASLNISTKAENNGNVKVAWTAVSENKAHGYQIQYAESTSDLFNRTGSFKSKTVSGRKNSSTTISDLVTGHAYVFRVRAYVDYTNSVSGAKTRTWSQYSPVKEAVPVNTTPKTPQEIYREFLEKEKWTFTNEAGQKLSIELKSFCLLDVNRDGIPELFVKNMEPNRTFCDVCVFSIKNNNIFYCGMHFTRSQTKVIYNSTYKGILDTWWTNGVGGAGSVMYGIDLNNGGELVTLYLAWTGYDRNKEEFIYEIGKNREYTTKEVYDAYVNKYFDLDYYKGYTYSSNTAENRAKIK